MLLKVHHGSLAIARSLGRLGIKVFGVGPGIGQPQHSSRYLSTVEWAIEESPEGRSVDFLLETASRIGTRCVLIATSDRTAALVADHADALGERYLFACPPAGLVHRLASKREMSLLARESGVPTPQTSFPTSREEVVRHLERMQLPIMLKAVDGARLEARTGVRMVRVETAEELLQRYEELEEPGRPNLMLQEYIPGGDDSIWMFNGYFDHRSACLFGATGQKLRQTPVYAGATSLGICVPNENVHRLTVDFMRSIGYRGILDIGYRFDMRDGQYKVLDVNPRVGSTFRLWTGVHGLDVVRALYRDLTGQGVPADSVQPGRKWLIEDKDLESAVRYWRDGKLTVGQWLQSLRGVRELAWFAWDDPRPGVRVAGRSIARALQWCWRQLRGLSSPHSTASRPGPGAPKTK